MSSRYLFNLEFQNFIKKSIIKLSRAVISKKLFKIKGTYGVKINPAVSDDSVRLILGIEVMVHHEKEENR